MLLHVPIYECTLRAVRARVAEFYHVPLDFHAIVLTVRGALRPVAYYRAAVLVVDGEKIDLNLLVWPDLADPQRTSLT